MTVNQIHKKYVGDKTPFKTWINVEQFWFDKTKPIDYKFDEWVAEKYSMNGENTWLNADGDVSDKNKKIVDWISQATGLVGSAASIYDTYGNLHNETEAANAETEKDTKSKKVFGIQPTLFWGLVGIVVLGGSVLIYKKMNK